MALLFYSSSKRTSFTRKDSTAIGQTASLAAVALLLNTNNPSTTTPDPELAGGPERDSERIRSYRNSVAYIDAEVETLISRQRRGSKFVLPRLVNLIIQLFWNIHLWTTIWSLNWSLILMPWYIFNVLSVVVEGMLDNPYSILSFSRTNTGMMNQRKWSLTNRKIIQQYFPVLQASLFPSFFQCTILLVFSF